MAGVVHNMVCGSCKKNKTVQITSNIVSGIIVRSHSRKPISPVGPHYGYLVALFSVDTIGIALKQQRKSLSQKF